MQQKKTTLLAAAITIFVIVALVSVFWLSSLPSGERPSIVVPSPSYTNADIQLTPALLNDPENYLQFQLTPETVGVILDSLRLPETYTLSYTTSVYTAGKQFDTQVTLRSQNGMFRISMQDRVQSTEYLVTDDRTYGWLTGQKRYRSFDTGAITAFQTAKMPSVETLTNLNARQIQQTAFRELNQLWTIYLVYTAPYGLTEHCYVSIDSGLVIRCESYDDTGTLVLSTVVTSQSFDELDVHEFLLPNGASAQ